MKKLMFLLFLTGISNSKIFAQAVQEMTVDVFQNNVQLVSPFAGGLKSPQFSEVDLNGDGIQDLFIFDKAGNVRLTFINRGTSNEIDYEYAPFYAKFFPELSNWALLRDFNGDGIMDIFSQYRNPGISGVEVHVGRFDGNHIAFDRFNFPQLDANIIPIPTGGNQFTQMYISLEDIPAIDDINGDGDMDILTFSDGGGVVYLYENQSMEQGYGKDSLIFRRVDECWGKFYESGIDNCLTLSDDPEKCEDGFTTNGVHAGSTLLTFDTDNDGDKEVLLGDISFTEMVFAINGGTKDKAFIDDQDCAYPAYDIPVDITSFPASFMLDVNNDGRKDLLATANTENIGVSFKSIWYYQNTNTNEEPVFALQNKNFMIDEILQFGLGANPTFVDVNADGLMDIVVGNFRLETTGLSNLYLLENVGTKNEPAFVVADEDWLGFKDIFATSNNHFDFVTSFGDLDGDGDQDLLVGDNSGSLLYLENTAGPGQPMAFGQIQGDYMGIDPGQASAPELIDINRDGLLDIIIGERTVNADPNDSTKVGNINYFQNIGTATAPMFNPDADAPENSRYFGRINTIAPGLGGFNKGEASPAIFDTGKDFIVFTGSASGRIMAYDKVSENLDGAFHEITRDFANIRVGTQTRMDAADINNDGLIDLIIGNKRGGLNFYSTFLRTDAAVGTQDLVDSKALNLFPNPANEIVYLEWTKEVLENDVELSVFDALGRKITQQEMQNGTHALDVANWSPGIYFANVRVGAKRIVKRFVVSR